MPLQYFDVVQPNVEDVETNDSSGHTPEVHLISALVTFTPSVEEIQSSALDATVLLRPIVGRIVDGVLCSLDDTPGIELVAYTAALGTLPDPLTYRVDYSKVRFDKGDRALRSFRFAALTGPGTVDLNTVARLPLI
jgi:hypothetical protein